jgi:hypothetical protein
MTRWLIACCACATTESLLTVPAVCTHPARAETLAYFAERAAQHCTAKPVDVQWPEWPAQAAIEGLKARLAAEAPARESFTEEILPLIHHYEEVYGACPPLAGDHDVAAACREAGAHLVGHVDRSVAAGIAVAIDAARADLDAGAFHSALARVDGQLEILAEVELWLDPASHNGALLTLRDNIRGAEKSALGDARCPNEDVSRSLSRKLRRTYTALLPPSDRALQFRVTSALQRTRSEDGNVTESVAATACVARTEQHGERCFVQPLDLSRQKSAHARWGNWTASPRGPPTAIMCDNVR